MDAKKAQYELAAAKAAANQRDLRDVKIERLQNRIDELEAELAAVKKTTTEAPQPAKPNPNQRRDRRDYMREFMRQKRATQQNRR